MIPSLRTASAAVLASAAFAMAPAAFGADATPTLAAITRDGSHDFDFDFGVWKTEITRRLHPLSPSTETMKLTGTVTIRKVWGGKASIEEIEPAIFDEIFHLNVLGPIVAMQAVIPLMRAQGGGSIVNINSGTAFMTVPQYSVYSSSKRALLGFSLTARAELEKDRIVVSEIYPFITATNFGNNRMGNPAGGGPASNYGDGDKPEFVAGLVLQAIEEGQAQYFANDRLRQLAGVSP